MVNIYMQTFFYVVTLTIIHLTSRHRGAIDLTPWVVSISSSFLLFGLYNYVY